jgi:hypothetical protein
VVLVQLHVEHVARRFTSIRIARALPAAKAAASDEKLDPGPLWRPRKAGLGHIFLALALVQCPRFTLGVFGGSEPGPDVNAADTGTAALLPPRKKKLQPLFETHRQVSNMSLEGACTPRKAVDGPASNLKK